MEFDKNQCAGDWEFCVIALVLLSSKINKLCFHTIESNVVLSMIYCLISNGVFLGCAYGVRPIMFLFFWSVSDWLSTENDLQFICTAVSLFQAFSDNIFYGAGEMFAKHLLFLTKI